MGNRYSFSKGQTVRSFYKMESGYAWVLSTGGDWVNAPSEDWETEMVVKSESEKAHYLGRRIIDRLWHTVYALPDGRYAAQINYGG